MTLRVATTLRLSEEYTHAKESIELYTTCGEPISKCIRCMKHDHVNQASKGLLRKAAVVAELTSKSSLRSSVGFVVKLILPCVPPLLGLFCNADVVLAWRAFWRGRPDGVLLLSMDRESWSILPSIRCICPPTSMIKLSICCLREAISAGSAAASAAATSPLLAKPTMAAPLGTARLAPREW